MAGTLLGAVTGGKYQQSSDLPPLTQAIPAMFNAYNKRLNKALTTGGTNVFGNPAPPFDMDQFMQNFAMGSVGGGPLTKDVVRLFRGVPRWFRGEMVRGGKHVGGRYKNAHKQYGDTPPAQITSDALHTTPSRELAEHYGSGLRWRGESPPDPRLLEYHVPISKVPKQYREVAKGTGQNEVVFKEGLSKKYLKKVHKLKNKDYSGDEYLRKLVKIKSADLSKHVRTLFPKKKITDGRSKPKTKYLKESLPYVRNKNWWDNTGDY